MGIRIHKDIGYFIPLDQFSGFLVPNYQEVIEDLDQDDDKANQFWEVLQNEMANYTGSGKILIKHAMKQYTPEARKAEGLEPYHLASPAHFYDDEVGFLFQDYDLYKQSRFDNLIDYYETPIETSEINYLNRPIYPNVGYVYKGGMPDPAFDLVAGTNYPYSDVAYIVSEHTKNDKEILPKDIVDTNFFHPKIDPLIYMIAKASGVLMPHVTEELFNATVAPAILVYWG
jgi:hypothetical protein